MGSITISPLSTFQRPQDYFLVMTETPRGEYLSESLCNLRQTAAENTSQLLFRIGAVALPVLMLIFKVSPVVTFITTAALAALLFFAEKQAFYNRLQKEKAACDEHQKMMQGLARYVDSQTMNKIRDYSEIYNFCVYQKKSVKELKIELKKRDEKYKPFVQRVRILKDRVQQLCFFRPEFQYMKVVAESCEMFLTPSDQLMQLLLQCYNQREMMPRAFMDVRRLIFRVIDESKGKE